MTHSPIDVAVNPNNQAQRYILWTNGRIDNEGGAPPITGPSWYDRLDTVAMALHITNWTTGAGYVLDWQGGFTPLGGAPNLMVSGSGSGQPGNADGLSVPGVPYYGFRCYIDWSWNPDGNGQGYVLDLWGQLYAFGGATAAPRSGPRFTTPIARRLKMQWTPTRYAVTMTANGGLYGDFGLNLPTDLGNRFFTVGDWARDLAITDWSSAPYVKGYTLDQTGVTWPFGGAPTSGQPGGVYQHADVARAFRILSAVNPTRIWQVWSGGQQFEYVFSDPPTVVAGAGGNEVQRITITGNPTGGSFTMSFGGQTTASTAYNATAATVQTRLTALSTIGAGNVTVTGGPGPGTPYVVTFTGTLAGTNPAQITTTSSLTGGSSPAVTVTTTTQGIAASPPSSVTTTTRPTLAWAYNDPQGDQQTAWQVLVFTQAWVNSHDMTDPLAWTSSALVAREGADRTARGIVCPVDLVNGAYRMYVRAKDSSDKWSAWSNRGWTQNITAPATPTGLTATADNDTLSVSLSVQATASANADLIRFDWTYDGINWSPVRGADALPLLATTVGADRDAPMGRARTYRATAYSVDPRIASGYSATASATITRRVHALTSTADPALGGRVRVQEPAEWTRPVKAGVFEGAGAKYPTVVSDGAPKARRLPLHLLSLDRPTWEMIDALVGSNSTLVYRDPFGEVIYCRVAGGDWTRKQLRAEPLATETTPLRHAHTTPIPLVEVAGP